MALRAMAPLAARPAVVAARRLARRARRATARLAKVATARLVPRARRATAPLARSASAASAALRPLVTRPANARFGSPERAFLFFAPDGGGRDGDREDAVLEVRVDRLLGEEEDVLHLVAAARETLPVGERAELDERREEELARALEQNLPAGGGDLDATEPGLLEPADDPVGVGQLGHVAVDRGEA